MSNVFMPPAETMQQIFYHVRHGLMNKTE